MTERLPVTRARKGAEGTIILMVFDGLSGLPREPGGPTELEAAATPCLDELAAAGTCGLLDNILPGVTPGSGPAHLSLFGYDPLELVVGRGLFSALGIGFPIELGDLAARINFCTVDPSTGIVVDRRAGRLASSQNAKLVALLDSIEVPGCELFVRTVSEHRACVVFRGEELHEHITESDPQEEDREPPRPIRATHLDSRRSAAMVAELARQANERLAGLTPANAILVRGYAVARAVRTLGQRYGLRGAAIATYPMYKGVGKFVGLDVLDAGSTLDDECACLRRHYDQYDFFFVHYKEPDCRAEDGEWEKKVAAIAAGDRLVACARQLGPAVLAVTGDHSTPSVLGKHSWHPVPVVVWSKWARPDAVRCFGERACARGGLGRQRGVRLMPILVAHALGWEKYGA